MARFDEIRPNFSQNSAILENPKPTNTHPKTNTTRPSWFETSFGLVAGWNLPHLIMSSRVRVGYKPDPAQPVDCPSHNSFFFSLLSSSILAMPLLQFIFFSLLLFRQCYCHNSFFFFPSSYFSNHITTITFFLSPFHHIISLSFLLLFVTIAAISLLKFTSLLISLYNFEQYQYRK